MIVHVFAETVWYRVLNNVRDETGAWSYDIRFA